MGHKEKAKVRRSCWTKYGQRRKKKYRAINLIKAKSRKPHRDAGYEPGCEEK